jgi:hypothetical protein
MILPKIDANRFIKLVSDAPLIAFQRFEYGAAVAAPGEAYYAPMDHPGGGNLSDNSAFGARLALASLIRMGMPALRTLRPTAQPRPQLSLLEYINTFGGGGMQNFEEAFKHVVGDHPAVIEFQTQVVITAIEQHARPDLQAAMSGLKREAMVEACERIREEADLALSAIEQEKGPAVTLYLMQCTAALKFALELLLKP